MSRRYRRPAGGDGDAVGASPVAGAAGPTATRAESSDGADSSSAPAPRPVGDAAELVWRHPALMFMTGACLWSWLWWSAAAGPAGGRPVSVPPPVALIALGIGNLGPSLVGVMCTVLAEGEDGIARVLSRQLFAAHSPAAWLAALVPTATGIAAAALLPALPTALGGGGAPLAIVPAGVVALVAAAAGGGASATGFAAARALLSHAAGAGIAQTWGWAGFVLPHLLRGGAPPLRAAALLGFLTAAWRAPLLWLQHAGPANGPTAGPVLVALLALAAVPHALLLVAVYLHTRGSLFVAAALYAGAEAAVAALHVRLAGPGVEPAARVAFAALWLLLANALVALPAAVALWRLGAARAARAAAGRRRAAARRASDVGAAEGVAS